MIGHTNFIDLYPQATPNVAAKKAATPWEGNEGERARKLGVRTEDEFKVFALIVNEALKSAAGAHLSNGDIARRLKLPEAYAGALVQDLTLRSVVRVQSGFLGVQALVPVTNPIKQ
jgi:hypothetical protein